MIIFLYGPDQYRLRMQLNKIQKKFRDDRDPSGMNVSTVDFGTKESDIKELLLASPFLADKRMVVAPNLFENASKEMLQWLEEKHEDFSSREDTIYVFCTELEKVKKAQSGVFEKMSSEKFAQKFEIPSGSKLEAWVLQLVKEFDGSIDRQAASQLAISIPNDTWKLANRIHQLVMYKGGESITSNDVSVFVDQKVEDVIFALMDAFTKKDRSTALTLLESQYKYGTEPMQIFGMMIRQYRILSDISSYQEANNNPTAQEIASSLKLHPFVVKKTLPLLNNYSFKDLKRGEQILLAMDRKNKTGAAQMDELLHWLVVSC